MACFFWYRRILERHQCPKQVTTVHQCLKGEAPSVQYTVNGTQYDMGYYLADKIYPEWAVFVKTISASQMDEDKLFALMQEGAKKDVECAFGVLQSRFYIVRRPSRLWK